MNWNKLYTLIFISCLSFTVMAQESETATEEQPNTLSNQFEDMKKQSNTYQEYKVIKIANLNTFWRNVEDSVKTVRQDLVKAQEQIESQRNEVEKMELEIAEREKAIEDSEYEMAHITVMGIDIQKENYIYLNFGIILALALILAFFIFRFKHSNKVAQDKKARFNELELQFDDYKKTSREKELKIKRELQTEMNRAEELKQKLSTIKKPY